MSDIWTAVLAKTLVRANRAVGSIWAWRITRLIHAIPFLIGAWFCGWAIGWVWDFMPMLSAWLCSGFVAVGMAWDWIREWWRG